MALRRHGTVVAVVVAAEWRSPSPPAAVGRRRRGGRDGAIARRPGPALLAVVLLGSGAAVRADASWDGLAPDRLGPFRRLGRR